MDEMTTNKIEGLFARLTDRYRSKKYRQDARIKFHLELDKIDNIQPSAFRFINEVQMEFCFEYTRLRNIFNRSLIRKYSMNKISEYLATKSYLVHDPLYVSKKKTTSLSPIRSIETLLKKQVVPFQWNTKKLQCHQ